MPAGIAGRPCEGPGAASGIEAEGVDEASQSRERSKAEVVSSYLGRPSLLPGPVPEHSRADSPETDEFEARRAASVLASSEGEAGKKPRR